MKLQVSGLVIFYCRVMFSLIFSIIRGFAHFFHQNENLIWIVVSKSNRTEMRSVIIIDLQLVSSVFAQASEAVL